MAVTPEGLHPQPVPAASRGPAGARMRWLAAPLIAAVVVWLLLALMQWMIRAPARERVMQDEGAAVEMVRVEPPKDNDESTPPPLPSAAPPPPPPPPPSLSREALPSAAAPAFAISSPTVDIAVPAVEGNEISIGSGTGLSGSGTFGGFAGSGGGGGGNGGGGGGGGYAHGESFSGKELVPTSTARPQMPDWACRQKIKGWVEVVFTVLPSGRVSNVRLVDAQPRGVYEAAAIESVSNWIYESSKLTREVKQRVDMDPADCAYNWR